jgi:YebC/PmpR family DNA-binding regulatory protein
MVIEGLIVARGGTASHPVVTLWQGPITLAGHVWAFQMGLDQAQEGDCRRAPRTALHQAGAGRHRGRQGRGRRPHRESWARPRDPEGTRRLHAQRQHRTIQKGTGAGVDAESFESVTYEGYAHGGVAILIEALTDNRNRTAADVRHIVGKYGGSLGEPGSVSYLFEKQGVIVVEAENYSEDDLIVAIDAGAQDIVLDDDVFEVITTPADFTVVRDALTEAGIEIESSDVTQRPKSRVLLQEEEATKLMKLIDALEESDDVGAVHANYDVDADVLERILG